MDVNYNGAGTDASALSFWDFAYERGKLIVDKLEKIIPRQQFECQFRRYWAQKWPARTDTRPFERTCRVHSGDDFS